MRIALIILLVFSLFESFSQRVSSFNDNWMFVQGEDTINNEWENIQIPHTWNSDDPFDKIPEYYCGLSWYKKSFSASSEGRVFLVFEGVNQEVKVFVNGKLAGSHLGGYTAFNVELTDYISEDGHNEIALSVDNSHNETVPPLKGDFNFYGGVYRDVWLHQADDIHFNFSEYGDQGVFIRTPEVSTEQAKVEITTSIHNQSNKKTRVVLEHILYYEGEQVAESKEKVNLTVGVNSIKTTLPAIQNPKLWHPDDPQLYRLASRINTSDGTLLGTKSNPVGFRWFKFDPNTGFSINGQPLKLMGSNRHQDYEGKGNALLDERHWADVQLIKEMGSNFFRTAHYPQDPVVMDAADQLGLVVSMEIPLDHEITDSDEFLENSKRMMQEMIRQNYNHPSIFIWAYMNEMMLGRKYERDKAIIEKIRLQAVELEELTRKEDPDRYTMIPNHGDLDLYIQSGLTDIPMIVGWNLYYGWYEADNDGAGKFLDRFHELVPDKPVLITEYGAGADPRIRSLEPERFDFSIEWQNQFHQNNLIQYFDRDYLSGAAIWNIADFGSESRNDAVPKINSKGVLEIDRTPKDAYYLYQAWLSKEPVVWIGSRNWDKREAYVDQQYPIEVYTNAPEAELLLNGKSLGKQPVNDQIAQWEVSFQDGVNRLEARISADDYEYSDVVDIQVRSHEPGKIDWYQGININCGATFAFNDIENDNIWVPDRAYEEGLWGYRGGETFRPRERGIGADQTIHGTTIDPIYQTQRVAPDEYLFDVDPGKYELTFHWAEIDKVEKGERVFSISINDKEISSEMDVLAEAGLYTALVRKIQIPSVQDQLRVKFKKMNGAPVINGLQVRRIN